MNDDHFYRCHSMETMITIDMFKKKIKSIENDYDIETTMASTLLGLRIDPYMIVCIQGSCAAGCNQEPVRAVVWRKMFYDIAGLLMS